MRIRHKHQWLHLLPDKALFWEEERTLLLADTHFGKDSIFRQHGIAVPNPLQAGDLARLSRLVTEWSAERLIILGDFLHGKLSKNNSFYNDFQVFLEQHASVQVDICIGNHDRHISTDAWPSVHWHHDLVFGPFVLSHHPHPDPRGYVLAGHVHPAYVLRAGRGDRLRMPVFWFQAEVAVLPSFGALTGAMNIKPQPGDALYGVGPQAVMKLMG